MRYALRLLPSPSLAVAVASPSPSSPSPSVASPLASRAASVIARAAPAALRPRRCRLPAPLRAVSARVVSPSPSPSRRRAQPPRARRRLLAPSAAAAAAPSAVRPAARFHRPAAHAAVACAPALVARARLPPLASRRRHRVTRAVPRLARARRVAVASPSPSSSPLRAAPPSRRLAPRYRWRHAAARHVPPSLSPSSLISPSPRPI